VHADELRAGFDWISFLTFGLRRHTAMSRACNMTSVVLAALQCPADDPANPEGLHITDALNPAVM
jgi:hypothetical protein